MVRGKGQVVRKGLLGRGHPKAVKKLLCKDRTVESSRRREPQVQRS